MWKLYILLIIPLVKPDCSLKTENGDDISWDLFNDHLIGSFEKTVAAETSLPGIIVEATKFKEMKGGACDPSVYFKISQPNDTYVSIISTDQFSNWDSTIAQSNCDFTLSFDTTMCTNIDGNPQNVLLNFQYTIIDVNSVPPKFNSDSYNIKIGFPIAQGISLNDANNLVIQTTDDDFSTKKVTYTIEEGSDDFLLVPLASSGRTFPVSFKTQKLVNLQKQVVLTLVATDDGTNTGPQSSKVQITIDPDLENSIPPLPEFSQTLYTADIILEDIHAGDVLPIDITLKEEFDDISVSIEPSDVFTATLTGKSITVTLSKDIADDGRHYINAVLTAKITSGTKTAQSSSVITIQWTDSTIPTTTTVSPDTPETPDTPPTPTSPPEDNDPDSGLVAATIIFAITTAVLLGIVGYGYYKYIYKRSVIVPTSQPFRSSGRSLGANEAGLENEKNRVRKPSRKRSITFSEDDEASRANRETSINGQNSGI